MRSFLILYFLHFCFTLTNAKPKEYIIESDILINEDPELFMKTMKLKNSIYQNLWPNQTLYYQITPRHFNGDEEKLILNTLKYISNYSCISFVERKAENKNYVRFIRGNGCYSSVGLIGGEQTLSLGNGCISMGTIIHEVYHALGFYHEQSRTDRDQYVYIYWDNIIKGLEYNFNKYNGQLFTPYDYKSLMHYDNQAFTNDWSKKTIVALDGTPLIHSSIKMYPSKYDQDKLNVLYKCKDKVKECYDKHPTCEAWIHNLGCNTLFLEVACPESCSIAKGTKCDSDKMLIKDYDTSCSYLKTNYCNLEYSKFVCLKSCPS